MGRAELLASYIQGVRRDWAGFRPGTMDCAHFTAGWVLAATGRDLATSWRGSYSNLGDGYAALARAGFGIACQILPQLISRAVPTLPMPSLGDIAFLSFGSTTCPWHCRHRTGVPGHP